MPKVGTEFRRIGYVGLGKPLNGTPGDLFDDCHATTGCYAGNMGLPMAQHIAKKYQLVRSCYLPGENCQPGHSSNCAAVTNCK